MRTLVTGANGHLGRKLIRHLQQQGSEVVAAVRSERAAETIRADGLEVDIRIVDYASAGQLADAAQGCDTAVHLVGIIKESRDNTFQNAHENPCSALVEASRAAGVGHVIYLGIVGTETHSSNTCFRSRANAERILQAGEVPATIIRVPMVLGPDDYASMALARNARSRIALTFRAASLEQPIFSQDVVAAIAAALALPPGNRLLQLAGPESLSRRELISRAARSLGNEVTVISLPIALGVLMAAIFELVSARPPVTRAMLGVLDHDDDVDVTEACEQLGLSLTSLDDMFARLLPDLG